jgi:2-dehydro-3-deoxy-D-arabinonate dehydratase
MGANWRPRRDFRLRRADESPVVDTSGALTIYTPHTPLKLYNTKLGSVIEHLDRWYLAKDASYDELVVRDDLKNFLEALIAKLPSVDRIALKLEENLLAPISSQEVWAAGVTYHRSRDARMEESESAGGGDFYDRVYHADRPELFFKASPHRVVGPGGKVAIRSDAKWSVPEPELALLISPRGKILGYTVGNDMSSRDIEGENPLYLPQAKVYDRSCALGPCVLLESDPMPRSTEIRLEILRGGKSAFSGRTSLNELKRDPQVLVDYLYRDNSFPRGCFLLTGTGIVPPDTFTLAPDDEIRITIDGIGTLTNVVG